jgi:hypothetical protein
VGLLEQLLAVCEHKRATAAFPNNVGEDNRLSAPRRQRNESPLKASPPSLLDCLDGLLLIRPKVEDSLVRKMRRRIDCARGFEVVRYTALSS